MMLFGRDVESEHLSENDADIVLRYHVAKARRWIIRVMTAAALFVILCVLVGGVR